MVEGQFDTVVEDSFILFPANQQSSSRLADVDWGSLFLSSFLQLHLRLSLVGLRRCLLSLLADGCNCLSLGDHSPFDSIKRVRDEEFDIWMAFHTQKISATRLLSLF